MVVGAIVLFLMIWGIIVTLMVRADDDTAHPPPPQATPINVAPPEVKMPDPVPRPIATLAAAPLQAIAAMPPPDKGLIE